MIFSSAENRSALFELHKEECEHVIRKLVSLPAKSVKVELGGTGFSGAIIFRVALDDDLYALRRWPSPTLPQQRILGLHRYLQHLKERNLPVAVPVSVPNSLPGRQCNRSLINFNGHYWQLEPWLPGEPKHGDEISDTELHEAMQTLARLHLASSDYVTSSSRNDWFSVKTAAPPTVQERISLIDSWNCEKLQLCERAIETAPSEIRDVCRSILNYFVQRATPLRDSLCQKSNQVVTLFPCWRDLWSEHVLFTNDKVTGLIDPNATRCDHVATDLSRLLGSYLGDDKRRWQVALESYQEVRPLTELDHELIHLFDKTSVLLSGMTWIHRWQSKAISADQFDKILDRLRLIKQRLQKL
ncbi:phosphotransferase enzyme family protein [Thalassoglobus polymorphus]|uniref:Homoserine kinase n=1 Tax=Thalassoglobus polymorphus TaxID=2527994 RepID=A0A517QV60_9PLAN|nr:phosphotransferase [Thalassoglobus polymorphus]QDT35510.1 homoserine kinase [Thalassoglobus polymorphus]